MPPPCLSSQPPSFPLCFAFNESQIEGWSPIAFTTPWLACSFGASADHWRKNLPVVGQSCRCYAIDLLGYGYSDKVCWQLQPLLA